MVEYLKTYRVFFGSIFFGIMLWFLYYLFLPVTILEPLKFKTIAFVLSCYIMLTLGFISINFNYNFKLKRELNLKSLFNLLLVIVIVSYLLRWYDLFVIRDLSFFNYPKDNRNLNDLNSVNSNYLFNIASVLKSIYFFPLVLVLNTELRKVKKNVLIAYLLMLFPIVESILKGTRKPFFEIFLIIILCYLLFSNWKITFKKVFTTLIGLFILLTISANILYNRESKYVSTLEDYYDNLLNARYNDLLPLKENVKSFFYDKNVPEPIKSFVFINMQTGQYILHGLFEFNHIIEAPLPVTYGSYTFNVPLKFLNSLEVLNDIKISNPSPREYVYLTAFGGFFIDFRWGTLLLFFLYGGIQKYVYLRSKKIFIYNPILIYIIIINVNLPLINYIRGSGVYPFLAFAFLLIILFIRDKILHEKSISA